jgi:hypothetical protein
MDEKGKWSGYDLVAEQGIAANDCCVPTVPDRVRVACRRATNPARSAGAQSGTGTESEVAADRVEDDGRAGTRCQPGTNRSDAAPLGKWTTVSVGIRPGARGKGP